MSSETEVSFEEMLTLSSKNNDEYSLIKKWYTKKDWLSEIKSWERQNKSDRRAEVIKNIGNAAYAIRDFQSAIKLYTDALLFAKHNGTIYGTILANISGCLYELGLFKKCVIYIDACFSTAYPNASRPKLHVRKIKALNSLGEKSSAAEATSDFKRFVCKYKISPETQEKYFKLAKEMVTEICDNDFIMEDYVLPEFMENPRILNVCESATLKYSKKYGRHIVAQKPIKKGECILMEKPYASLGYARCPNCFKCIKNIIPCDNCPGFMYCSKLCREQDDELHRWECKLYQLEKFRKLDEQFRLAFRIFLKGLQGGYKSNLNKIEEELCFGDKTDNFPYVQQIYGSFSEYPPLTKALFLGNCCVLLACINMEKNLKEWIGRKMGKDLFLIGKNLLQLIAKCTCNYNNHRDCDTMSCLQLHPSKSLFNHSCKPNTAFCLQDDRIVMRALEDICPGEQIFMNYIYGIDAMSLEVRKDILFRCHFLTCHCSLCTTEIENRLMLPCPECNFYCDVVYNNLITCKSCGAVILNWDGVLKMKTILDAQIIYQTCKDINVLHEGIKVAQEMRIKSNCHFMYELYMQFIFQSIIQGTLDQSANFLQYIKNDGFLNSFHKDIFGALKMLIKKMCSSSEWHSPKYKKSTLLEYGQYLMFLHELVSLYKPIKSVLKDIKKLQMFFSIQEQIMDFRDSSGWIN